MLADNAVFAGILILNDSVARGPIALMVGQVSGNQHSRGAQLYSCCKTHNKSVGVVTHARDLVSCVMFVS